MEKLGVVFVEDMGDVRKVVVMDKFDRGVKLLIGLNQGAAIVRKTWIKACIKAGKVLDSFEEYYV